MQPDWVNASLQAAQLFDQNKFDEASQLAQSALQQNPDAAMALQVLGFVDLRKGRIHQAIERLEKASAFRPDFNVAHNGLGCCYYRLGNLDKAMYHFDRALILQPVYPIAHFSRGEVLLKRGDFANGWVEYEWRWTAGLVRGPEIPRPKWDGSPLNGRSLLIHSEQGVGDVLMIIRLLPLVKKTGGRIVFACHKPLKALLENNPYVDRWFPIDEPANIDFEMYIPLLCLPGLLNINEQNLPKEVPYIKVDPARIEKWRPIIKGKEGYKIGIGWQGSPTFEGDMFRSIPLKHYAAFAKVPGVKLISLQKGDGIDQLNTLRNDVPVEEIPDLDKDGAFLDTAAIMHNLDLVITSDTALAHLAGALGIPVWMMVNTGCDWRWGHDRADSYWYPSMRIFRQHTLNDWDSVFADVAAALKERIAGKETVLTKPKVEVDVPVSAGELLDKISILEIKFDHIKDAGKMANIKFELELLQKVRKLRIPDTVQMDQLAGDLKDVNLRLWQIEDDIRMCEKAGDFSKKFVDLARSVYQQNDRRSAIKRQVNDLLGSAIVEEKSYA